MSIGQLLKLGKLLMVRWYISQPRCLCPVLPSDFIKLSMDMLPIKVIVVCNEINIKKITCTQQMPVRGLRKHYRLGQEKRNGIKLLPKSSNHIL